jgi:hypothetical protein
MDAIEEIKKLYYSTTKATIQKDLDRAIDLLKTLPGEEEREKVAVYMDGLAQMRSEWSVSVNRHPTGSRQPPSGPRRAGPPARSDRSTASSRRRR